MFGRRGDDSSVCCAFVEDALCRAYDFLRGAAETGSTWRKLIVGAVIIIVLVVIFMRGDDLVELANTISQAAPLFIILAVIAQLGKYTAQGFGYHMCFRVVDEDISFRTGITMVFGSFFVNTVAPSFNLAGVTLIVNTATKHGAKAGPSTSSALLMQLCIDTGFVCIMLITFGVLSFTVGLEPGWFILGLIAVVLVGGLALIMFVGGIRPDLVQRVAHPFVKLIDRILARFKRGPIDDSVNEAIGSYAGASKLIVKRPARTLRAWSCSLIASCCEICCFALTGVSFGIYDPAALVCGYVVATLFAMVSFVPQGIGVVEAASVVSFALFGIDAAAGLAVIMVYRSIVFWMPFIIGAIVVQVLGLNTGRKKKDAPAEADAQTSDDGIAAEDAEKSVGDLEENSSPIVNDDMLIESAATMPIEDDTLTSAGND